MQNILIVIMIIIALTSCSITPSTEYGKNYTSQNSIQYFHSNKPYLRFFLLSFTENKLLEEGYNPLINNSDIERYLLSKSIIFLANGEPKDILQGDLVLVLDCGSHFERQKYSFLKDRKWILKCNNHKG